MPSPLGPRKYQLGDRCTGQCKFNARNLPISELAHTWFEAGNNNETIMEKAALAWL